jgi:hypothetical protein
MDPITHTVTFGKRTWTDVEYAHMCVFAFIAVIAAVAVGGIIVSLASAITGIEQSDYLMLRVILWGIVGAVVGHKKVNIR